MCGKCFVPSASVRPPESASLEKATDTCRTTGNAEDVERATFAYGYGLTVTPLQLAKAYTTIARGGERRRDLRW
ncbi:MAG: penicillin-binding transpeptidase domain-containing protein [Gammaproteobacteria bacterium]|nr:penicillin-binding transpeptidase domain-containing protein [Gammaproteobacteria bacterium]